MCRTSPKIRFRNLSPHKKRVSLIADERTYKDKCFRIHMRQEADIMDRKQTTLDDISMTINNGN